MSELTRTRRDFLKLAGVYLPLLSPPVRALIAAGTVLLTTSCKNNNREFNANSASQAYAIATATPKILTVESNELYTMGNEFDSEAIFLSLATRYSPDQFYFIRNRDHRDILSAILRQNSVVSSSDFQSLMEEAIRGGYACGLSGCVDARVNYPKFFPNVIEPSLEIDLQTGELVSGRTTDMVGQPVYKIGTQPAVFSEGINISVFGPHQASLCNPNGCGAWDAIGQLVNDPKGLDALRRHGVTQTTIDDLTALYNDAKTMGLDLSDLEVQKSWARIGAQMQSEANVKKWGGNHFTAYGVYGHADDTFQAIAVVDAFGNEYPIENFPKLKAVTSYLNKPHPIIEYIAQGQQPIIIAANGSRIHTIPDLFGDLTQESGLIFGADVDKIAGRPITVDEVRKMLAGTDYGKNVLQSKNFVVLIADTPEDMAMLRNTLLTTGLEKGGLVEFFSKENAAFVEMIPDKNGHFSEIGYIRNVEDLFPDAYRIDPTGKIIRNYGYANNNKSFFLNQLNRRVERDYLLGIIDDVQFSKINRIIEWFNTPGFRFAGKIGLSALQMFGDAVTIIEFVRWFEEDLLGKSLVYKNSLDNVKLTPDARVLTTKEEIQFLQKYKDTIIPLTLGHVEKITIPQSDLIEGFAGAVRGWMEKGQGSLKPIEKQEPPWRDIKYEELSQLLTIEVLDKLGSSGTPIQLFTTLEVVPYDENFVRLGKPPGFRNQDPDQKMALIDTQTGIPILPDVEGQKITISAFDPNKPTVRYFFELSVPDNNQTAFELRFVGLGCVP
ncbi:MAG: hypothetical protein US40_C0015G0024 [Candidatus Roizmanbacteria bacterium GW2011_GWC2_37_13]|uniref:Uncharacterized protein n=1 Tax=Candidatus Roizmanbacteria bacterium GW2011_GWC2_37_13 TaxID=1618486 RepID=A0A0G0G075_9BACT|nr:MAG: hypothetical protein US38_C0015G0004 [Candidatus Roizmanbacteria bacterium GW2011_GWC1_37_12]KKQ24593.1 MAG: hypothetical protein US40_C0015G0024 [Candidatus Roizmanbacteria bacterium GW2011_GWC2_37_13]